MPVPHYAPEEMHKAIVEFASRELTPRELAGIIAQNLPQGASTESERLAQLAYLEELFKVFQEVTGYPPPSRTSTWDDFENPPTTQPTSAPPPLRPPTVRMSATRAAQHAARDAHEARKTTDGINNFFRGLVPGMKPKKED